MILQILLELSGHDLVRLCRIDDPLLLSFPRN
jgi:hypothetical protein